MKVTSVSRSDGGGFVVDAHINENPANVQLIPCKSEMPDGQLMGVVIKCDSATFTTQGKSDSKVLIDQTCEGVCFPPRTVNVPLRGESALASEVLGVRQKDPVSKTRWPWPLIYYTGLEMYLKALHNDVIVCRDCESVALEVASRFACAANQAVAERGQFVAAIPGGREFPRGPI